MKKVRITTPENIEIEVVLAEVLSRCTAAMIDSLIQAGLALLAGWGVLAMINYFFIQGTSEYYGWLLGGLILIEVVVMYGYYIISEVMMQGRTIGKKVMHLRSIRSNGAPMTIKHIIIRNLFRVFLDNFGLGIFFMFFNKKNKRIGDIVAGTMVIIEEAGEIPKPLEEMVTMSEEVKGYLTQEEYTLLREYFNRKETMAYYEPLRIEMRKYFKDRFLVLGIYENNISFIEAL